MFGTGIGSIFFLECPDFIPQQIPSGVNDALDGHGKFRLERGIDGFQIEKLNQEVKVKVKVKVKVEVEAEDKVKVEVERGLVSISYAPT